MHDIDPVAVPVVKKVAEGVVIRVAVDNMGWIDLGDCLLAVDALEQPELEAEILIGIRDAFGDKPVQYVLNTHTHYDHVALNAAFESRFRAEIVNQRRTTLPPEGRWFEGSTRKVLMRPMPGCHTQEDCIVWVPDVRVLFVGDIFGWGLVPWDANLRADKRDLITDTYRELIAYDPVCVMPGHGPLCGKPELARWLGYFLDTFTQAQRLASDGLSSADITARLQPPADMHHWWRFLQWKHDDTVKKIVKAATTGI